MGAAGLAIAGPRNTRVPVKALAEQVAELDGVESYGRVVGVRWLMVEVAGPIHAMSVGARVVIETGSGRNIRCEVVGFSGTNALLMPFAALEGVRRGCRAVVTAVAAAVRRTLDGHIVMERAIAERGRYPAINVLKSISRTMPRSADQAYLPVINHARQVMATYSDMEELIRLGAYRAGTRAEVDEAIRLHGPLEEFLAQSKEEATSLGQGYQRLGEIMGSVDTEN